LVFSPSRDELPLTRAHPNLHHPRNDSLLPRNGNRIGNTQTHRLTNAQTHNPHRPPTVRNRIKDAEENLGDSEVREALLAKAEFFVEVGDRAAALAAFAECEKKTVAIGQKMEMVFSVMRLHIFHSDWVSLKAQIAKLKEFLEAPGGADWERKNKLKVYEGVHMMACRNFAGATQLFLESLSTFTTYELMTYPEFIFYTVVCSVVSLKRTDLKEKVIDSPEVLSVVDQLPGVGELVNALHACKYREFMTAFPAVADQVLASAWLTEHHRYFLREARVTAYGQFLQSYKSVTTASMAAAFAVSEEFLDAELSNFIVNGRLNAKIDKVNGVLVTNRPDTKNALYQSYIKEGDQLLNRIQKLSRVIDL
jgi:26S proteasome regulatory subunit N7